MYSDFVIKAVRQHLGLNEHDSSRDDEINRMSKHELLNHCLEWEGIYGFTNYVLKYIDSIYETSLLHVR